MRLAHAAVLAALAVAIAPASAAADGEFSISEARGAGFPERAYVLRLPERMPLQTARVRVTENDRAVQDLQLSAGAGLKGTGVMLAIDASTSMHGQAIEDAMAAARAFAARRRPEQELGVLFFSADQTVALAPTTDAAKIDGVLAAPPTLTKGTQLFDAAKTAVDVLRVANLGASSIVVLSDGADFRSKTTAAATLEAAARAKVRIFSVGLRSSESFDSEPLRQLAAGSGDYIEALKSADLARIFDSLGRRFGNEYVISYRSLARLGTRVAVGVEVEGVPGIATAAYDAPAFTLGGRPPGEDESSWRSPRAVTAVAIICALLLSMGLAALIMPRRRSVVSRIDSFVASEGPFVEVAGERTPVAALVVADRRLERFGPWTAFKLDVELGGIGMPAIRIALFVLTTTAALAYLLAGPAGSPSAAVVVALAIPVTTRIVITARAARVRRRFADQLAENLQVLASALRAGHSFIGALSVMVDDAAEPSRTEYQRVLSQEQLGRPIDESLDVVSERMRNDDVSYIGLIATLQQETGGNTAEVLDRVVHTIRERSELRRLVSTLTAQGRLGGWIVTALPVALIFLLSLVNPDYMDPMLSKTLGQVILAVGFMMVGAGALIIRRIVDIEV